ncbi:MAG TPA: MerR family transcriptional regulator [Ferruginibacter sp.]|nr:MerR family transcriptional regulator [Ferruginibacter sp.]HMP19764.1 MerR family transcriptional regulator [Ferruginibacter sp.]
MAKQTQIAFDFGDIPPQPPAPVKKAAPPKPVVVEVPEAITRPAPAAVLKKKSTRGRKRLKDLARTADLIEVPEDEILFQKLYYPISRVADMFKITPALLRLWEKEFDVLQPKKNGKGDRLFRPEDIKNIQIIHHLTREKKYTIEGAKEYFRNKKRINEKFSAIESLKKIKGFLHELRANL